MPRSRSAQAPGAHLQQRAPLAQLRGRRRLVGGEQPALERLGLQQRAGWAGCRATQHQQQLQQQPRQRQYSGGQQEDRGRVGGGRGHCGRAAPLPQPRRAWRLQAAAGPHLQLLVHPLVLLVKEEHGRGVPGHQGPHLPPAAQGKEANGQAGTLVRVDTQMQRGQLARWQDVRCCRLEGVRLPRPPPPPPEQVEDERHKAFNCLALGLCLSGLSRRLGRRHSRRHSASGPGTAAAALDCCSGCGRRRRSACTAGDGHCRRVCSRGARAPPPQPPSHSVVNPPHRAPAGTLVFQVPAGGTVGRSGVAPCRAAYQPRVMARSALLARPPPPQPNAAR